MVYVQGASRVVVWVVHHGDTVDLALEPVVVGHGLFAVVVPAPSTSLVLLGDDDAVTIGIGKVSVPPQPAEQRLLGAEIPVREILGLFLFGFGPIAVLDDVVRKGKPRGGVGVSITPVGLSGQIELDGVGVEEGLTFSADVCGPLLHGPGFVRSLVDHGALRVGTDFPACRHRLISCRGPSSPGPSPWPSCWRTRCCGSPSCGGWR